MNERSVFLDALEITNPGERAAFLDRACNGDVALRKGVEGLLAANDRSGTFMPRPAVGDITADHRPAEGSGSRVGPYKLLQEIGEGGMGVVYMAEQEVPVRRKVALKIIKPGMDSKQVVARFEAERQALSMMDHPNIAKVFDAGTTESGRPFFVMELVHGVPITTYCDENKLTPRERLGLFIPVCQAIQHAHQKGIIHRDIKPSNILVTMYDDKPVSKVIDFGVAKAVEQRLTEKTLFTQYGALVGTFEYMSPEQAEMNAFGVDTRSDVFSLGVLLYELLTGTTPLERQRLRESALGEVIRMIKEEEPPRPSLRLSTTATLAKVAAARKTDPGKLSAVVRGELDWIVMRCLEKDRTRRYETASSLAKDVERYLKDEPVEACPPTLGYRLKKVYRKNRGLVIAASLVLLVLLAGIVGTSAGLFQANRARLGEIDQRNLAEIRRLDALADRDEKVKALVAEREAKQEVIDVKNGLQTSLTAERRTAYDMTIPEVQRAYRDNDLNRARALLASCPEDLRGFEWNLLNREFDRGAVTLRPAFTRDSSWTRSQIGISSDGKSVVAVTPHRSGVTVQTWSCENGGAAARFEIPAPADWNSPWRTTISRDFSRIAIWQPSRANKQGSMTSGEEHLGADGLFHRIGGASRPKNNSAPVKSDQPADVFVYDLSTGRLLSRLAGHPDTVSGAAFGPGNDRIATGCQDKIIRVWNASGKIEKELRGHNAPWSEPLAFTPDGKSLISVGAREDLIRTKTKGQGRDIGKRELRIWDLPTATARVEGEVSGVWYLDHEFPVRCTRDGRYAVGIDPLRQVIDLTTGKEAVPIPPGSTAVGFTDDGQDVIVVTYPGIVTRIRMSTGQSTGTYRLPWGELDGVYSHPTLNESGTALACLSPNMSVCITDPKTGFEIRTVPIGAKLIGSDVHRLVLDSARSRVVVVNRQSNEIKMWDLTARSAAHTLAALHSGINWEVAISPDAKAATCVSQSTPGLKSGTYSQISHVDLVSGRRVERTLPLRFRSVHDLCYSPDGKRVGGLFFALLTSSVNPLDRATQYTAVVLDTVTGKETIGKSYMVTYEASQVGQVNQPAPRMTCAADGTFLIAQAERKPDDQNRTWRIEEFGTGNIRRTLPGTGDRGFVFAPGGRYASLFGRKPGSPAIEIWDIGTGAPIPWPAATTEPRMMVEGGVFSSDGRRLLTLGEAISDGGSERYTRGPRQPRATVWDVRSGTAVCTFAPPVGTTAQWAIFSPDGERLLFYTGLASNNFVSLWNATTGRELLTKIDKEIHIHGGAFTTDGRLILEVETDLNRGERGSRMQVWDGTASGPVWKPAPTADGWLDEAERLLAVGRPADAVPVTQRLIDAFPTNVTALSSHGIALLRSGRPREAIDFLLRAVGKDITDQFLAMPLRSADHFLLASAYQQAGQPEEARRWFDAGETILRKFPVFPKDRPGISVSYATTPSAERARSEPFRVEAAQAIGIALKPLPPLNPHERMGWTNEVAKKGDHALAVQMADEILRSTRHVGILYNAACTYSLAAGAAVDEKLRTEYADRAMALLQEAATGDLRELLKKGTTTAVEHMNQDTDLNPIRKRDDFKKLMLDLEKPPTKGESVPMPREAK